MNEFETALEGFLTKAQKLINDYDEQRKNIDSRLLMTERGKRFIRVVSAWGPQRSAWAFIDTTNGDVLKPASWKAPAKHARGNIFDEFNGMKYVGPYGPAYLK